MTNPLTQIILTTFVCCLLPGVGRSEENPRRQKTMIYKKVGNRDLKVDVFWPAGKAKKRADRPAIAFFHGGGWVFGDRAVYHGACRRYAAMGFVTFSFEYRLSRNEDGSYPHARITPVESVKDARSAVRWLRRQAAALGIDPDRISVWGRSAGGQLAWATALCDDIDEEGDDPAVSPVPNALLTFSACYNTVQTWVDRMLGEQRARIWDISPYHRLKKGLPPAIGFHGRKDTTEPWRVANWFREKATVLGNRFELVTLEERGHHLAGGGEPPGELSNAAILKRVDAFLRETGMMPEKKGR